MDINTLRVEHPESQANRDGSGPLAVAGSRGIHGTTKVRPRAFSGGRLVRGLLVVLVLLLSSACSRNRTAVGPEDDARLVLGVQLENVNLRAGEGAGLGKSSEIILQHLILTLTSSVESDPVIRDTILAGAEGFSPNAMMPQQVSASYNVRALRSWTIDVQTRDINDSLIHFATTTVGNLGLGETRGVLLNLASRFAVYSAGFVLPDSIGSVTGEFREQLKVNRFVIVVDGDTVRDTTRPAQQYFAPAPARHVVDYNYARVDASHTVALYVYGDLNDWPAGLPLYSGAFVISSPDSSYTPVLAWTGPSTGMPGLEVTLGAVNVVNIEPVVPVNPLP